MDVGEYMARKCVCGRPRAEHAHFHERVADGRILLRVLPVPHSAVRCEGFLDEIELELGGNPRENPLLSPLVEERLAELRVRQKEPVS
jgi:hypothetical protein